MTQDVHPASARSPDAPPATSRTCTICRVNGVPSSWHSTRVLRRCRCSASAAASRRVSGTYRCRPPFGVVTCPFQSDRRTRSVPLREIDIAPFERDHLAAPQPRLTTQQARSGTCADRSPVRRRRAVRTRSKSWNAAAPFGTGSSSDPARHPLDHVPLHRLLQQDAEHGRDVVDRLWRLIVELRFQPLHVLALDRVELSATQRRDQVTPEGSCSFAAIPLGFCRFARAWPSTNLGANSRRVGTSLRG